MSVNSSICTFYSVVKLGQDFMHLLLCRCMMYQKSVAMKHITLDADLFHNVFSVGISCKSSYCRVSTVVYCMSKNSIVYYDVITMLSLSNF